MSEFENFDWTGRCDLEYPPEMALSWNTIVVTLMQHLKGQKAVVGTKKDKPNTLYLSFGLSAPDEEVAKQQAHEQIVGALGEDVPIRHLSVIRDDALDEELYGPPGELAERRKKAAREKISKMTFRRIELEQPAIDQPTPATVHELRPREK